MIEQEIEAVKQDTAALEQEIALLNQEKTKMMTALKEITENDGLLKELIEKYQPPPPGEVEDVTVRSHFRRPQRSVKRKRHKHNDYLPTDIFDSSIQGLLDTAILYSPSKKFLDRDSRIDYDTDDDVDDDDDDDDNKGDATELKKYIQLEKCYRVMFGVTCFPLVDPVDKREMIGLRFDVFDSLVGEFKKPMYMLMRKNDTDNWSVFHTTIPITLIEDLDYLLARYFDNSLSTKQDVHIWGLFINGILTRATQRHTYLVKYFRDKKFTTYSLDENARLLKYDFNGEQIELEMDKFDNVVGENVSVYDYSFLH